MRLNRSPRILKLTALSLSTVLAGMAVDLFPLSSASLAAPAPEPAPSNASSPIDLSTRIRFKELYTAEGEKPRPEVIGQYRVAVRETIKRVLERPHGAPERSENTFQTIYTERPAQVANGREVTDAVRRYEVFRVVPDRAKPSAPRPLEGLTLWYHPRAQNNPLILSLTEDRGLREIEYAILCRQIFLPDLKGVLPGLPVRVGDTWKLSHSAAQALFSDRAVRGEAISGKLVEIRRGERGSQWVAVLSLTGHALLMSGDTAVNAQVLFTFPPPEPAEGKKGDEGTIEALGGITEIRMALTATFALSSRPNERLRQVATREMVLERQLSGAGGVLAVPSPAPRPTEANSWLTYDDPEGRFHFRFPQELQQPPPPGRPDDGSIELVDHWPNPRDVIALMFQPKTGKPEEDRKLRDPETYRKGLSEQWQKERLDVIMGEAGWLPEADWAAAKMKVYRLEAVLKATRREDRRPSRMYFEQYLTLFGSGDSLALAVTTEQDPPRAFRKEAEGILRTFRVGPSKP